MKLACGFPLVVGASGTVVLIKNLHYWLLRFPLSRSSQEIKILDKKNIVF